MKLTYKHTVYASYIGYATQAIVNNLAPLLFLIFRNRLGLELSKITLLVTLNFLIQLTVDWVSMYVVDRIGYRKYIVTAHIFAAVGLLSMAALPAICGSAFAGLLIAVFFYAVGGGMIEVLISPIVEACPTGHKASAMSLLHSFYCWGTVGVVAVSTLLLQLIGKDKWQILPVIWAAVPVLNAFFFAKVPINELTERGEGMTGKALLKSRHFWLFVLLMVTAGASELAMSQWASAFAEGGLGVSKAVGDLAGPCMFSILMGTARVIISKLSKTVSIRTIMLCSGLLCIAAYLLTSLTSDPVLALAGCGICGFSVGVLWPGSFSLASEHFPKGGTKLFALLALAGDLGCAGGPTLVGRVADLAGENISRGLLAAAAFPVLLVICCLILQKSGRRTGDKKTEDNDENI